MNCCAFLMPSAHWKTKHVTNTNRGAGNEKGLQQGSAPSQSWAELPA